MYTLKFQRPELLNAINKAVLALPTKTTLPILESFLIKPHFDSIEITACDQEHLISAKCSIVDCLDTTIYPNISGFCVKGRTLQAILKLINSFEIEFHVSDKTLEIESINGKYSLPILPEDDYLGTSYFKGDPHLLCSLDSKQINDILCRTGFAYSKDPHRPSMSGYNFRFTNQKLQVVTTDSFMLGLTTIETDSNIDFEEIILMPKTITILSKLNESGELFVQKIRGQNSFITFESENCSVTSRIIAEKFPPYESILPITFEKSFKIDKFSLIKSIERIQHFTDQTTQMIMLTLDNNEAKVSGCDEFFGTFADEILPCDCLAYQINNAVLKFRAENLIDCLSAFNNSSVNEVIFNWTADTRPIIINQYQDADNLSLIMPLKS